MKIALQTPIPTERCVIVQGENFWVEIVLVEVIQGEVVRGEISWVGVVQGDVVQEWF